MASHPRSILRTAKPKSSIFRDPNPSPCALENVRRKLAYTQFTPPDRPECRFWTGAHSQSGGRGVFYPCWQFDGVTWRINRLVLLLDELPPHPEPWTVLGLGAALLAANRLHLAEDASHIDSCQEARCIRREHLFWEDHAANAARVGSARRALGVEAPLETDA